MSVPISVPPLAHPVPCLSPCQRGQRMTVRLVCRGAAGLGAFLVGGAGEWKGLADLDSDESNDRRTQAAPPLPAIASKPPQRLAGGLGGRQAVAQLSAKAPPPPPPTRAGALPPLSHGCHGREMTWLCPLGRVSAAGAQCGGFPRGARGGPGPAARARALGRPMHSLHMLSV